jgi:hypothetical protein
MAPPMRTDGTVDFFFIQHQDSRGEWAASALDHFALLRARDLVGEREVLEEERYRELLAPKNASSELWQTYGIHGFSFESDAREVLAALRVESPDTKFRIVRREVTQRTLEVMA